MKEKTVPLFGVNQIIKLDTKIADSGRGRIVGCEFGPDNKFLMSKHKGWVYTVREVTRDGDTVPTPAGEDLGFFVSEHELERMNNK